AAAVGVGMFLSARPSEEAVAADGPAPQLAEPEPARMIEPPTKPEPLADLQPAQPDASATPPRETPATDPVPKPSETTRCEKLRARALDARSAHDWDTVLDATEQRECWARASDRKKLETQAYMELGRFEDCLRAGKHLTDTEAKKWVTLCTKRLAG
ncbi:MAG TPA: hypothetical protein VM869_03810, partial [Enhygromyxa sp.]|nr:hypothetical protein [Enhygromyxa sp.]